MFFSIFRRISGFEPVVRVLVKLERPFASETERVRRLNLLWLFADPGYLGNLSKV
jgi:phosphomannomutase